MPVNGLDQRAQSRPQGAGCDVGSFEAAPSFTPLTATGRIVFTSTRNGNLEIYTMNADGSGQTNLSNNADFDFWPGWSPDGTKLVFASNRHGNPEIYVMNANGNNPTRLTDNPAVDDQPTWSVDGTRIAFFTNRDGNEEIYAIYADGSDPTNLSNNPAGVYAPSWGTVPQPAAPPPVSYTAFVPVAISQ